MISVGPTLGVEVVQAQHQLVEVVMGLPYREPLGEVQGGGAGWWRCKVEEEMQGGSGGAGLRCRVEGNLARGLVEHVLEDGAAILKHHVDLALLLIVHHLG